MPIIRRARLFKQYGLQGTHYTDGLAAQNRRFCDSYEQTMWVFWTFAPWSVLLDVWFGALSCNNLAKINGCIGVLQLWQSQAQSILGHRAKHNFSLCIAPRAHWIQRLNQWPSLPRSRGAMALHVVRAWEKKTNKNSNPRRTWSALCNWNVWPRNQEIQTPP